LGAITVAPLRLVIIIASLLILLVIIKVCSYGINFGVDPIVGWRKAVSTRCYRITAYIICFMAGVIP